MLEKIAVGVMASMLFGGCYTYRGNVDETSRILSREYQQHYSWPCTVIDGKDNVRHGQCSKIGLANGEPITVFHEDEAGKE